MLTNQIYKKSAVFAAAAGLVFSLFFASAAPAMAQATPAQLRAQIMVLQAQLAQLLAQLNGTSAAPMVPNACIGVVFSRPLVVGSTGTDVRCLQALLNQSPDTRVALSGAGSPGNETAYFGSLTRAALIKFQINNASSEAALDNASGIAGTQTLMRLSNLLMPTTATGPGPTTTGLPAGCASTLGYSPLTGQSCSNSGLPAGCTSTAGYSPVTGQACSSTASGGTTGGTTSGGLTINGQAGNFSATLNPSPADGVRVYAGDNKIQVMGIQVRAIGSDIGVQRVALDFNQLPYNFFTNISLYDGNALIATSPLNASTVSRLSATDYSVSLQNFQTPFIVSKNTTKVLMVDVDVVGALSSDVLQGSAFANVVLNVEANGIRAIDQSNASLLGPSSSAAIQRTINVNPSASTQANVVISRSVNSPLSGNITAGANALITAAPILGFNVNASGGSLTIDEIDHVAFTTGSGYLVPQTAYLYDSNNNVLASATPDQSTGLVDFTNLSIQMGGNAASGFTIRIDDSLASNGSENGKIYQVTVTGSSGNTAYFVVQRPNGTILAASLVSGSAQSYPQYAYLSGSMISLQGITTASTPRTQVSAPTISAVFNINVTASGGNIFIPKTGAFHVSAIANAVPPGVVATSTIYNQPTGTISLNNSYEIQQNTTATFTVNSIYVLAGASASYYLALTGVDWGTSDATPAANTTDLTGNNYISNIEFLQ